MTDQEELDKVRVVFANAFKTADLNGVRTLFIVEALISTAAAVFTSHGGSIERFGYRLEKRGQDIQQYPERYSVS